MTDKKKEIKLTILNKKGNIYLYYIFLITLIISREFLSFYSHLFNEKIHNHQEISLQKNENIKNAIKRNSAGVNTLTGFLK